MSNPQQPPPSLGGVREEIQKRADLLPAEQRAALRESAAEMPKPVLNIWVARGLFQMLIDACDDRDALLAAAAAVEARVAALEERVRVVEESERGHADALCQEIESSDAVEAELRARVAALEAALRGLRRKSGCWCHHLTTTFNYCDNTPDRHDPGCVAATAALAPASPEAKGGGA